MSNRIIYYHQSILGNGTTPEYISLKPMWETLRPDGTPYVTQLYLSAFNMGPRWPDLQPNTPYLHLNDIPLNNKLYDSLWKDVVSLQNNGVKVMMLLGGAGANFPHIDTPSKNQFGFYYNNNTWGLLWPGTGKDGITYYKDTSMDSKYYSFVLDTLTNYGLDGIGLDFENGSDDVTVDDVKTLITALRSDYKTKMGKDLIVSLTPVASGLSTGIGLAGFNYQSLFEVAKDDIDSFNGQFYNGFGTSTSPTGSPSPGYENIINTNWTGNKDQVYSFPPGQVVLGACISGCSGSIGSQSNYLDFLDTVTSLSSKYQDFGGVFAWTYTDQVPGEGANPVKWAVDVYNAMN
ncbi:MAG: glycosyl hydrolase family 18 protein [Bacteroidota bacterium]